uniref:Uncharacterized protein n=1 Tax=Gibberella zeae TaxID=5518 RepID=A0A4E9DQD1_GIBZA
MSRMTTPISTTAVVSWQYPDSEKFLAEPDPKNKTLTFKTWLKERSYFFEIWVPLYLKQRPKKIPSTYSSLILNIPFSTVETFSLHVLSTTDEDKHIPEPVAKKLKSPVLRLDIKLRDNISTIIPSDTDGTPLQGHTHSGAVLDNVRDILQAKFISVFIKHDPSHEAQLHAIGKSINDGHYRSTGTIRQDLQSLYRGEGGIFFCFPAQSKEALGSEPGHLPAYNEVASPIWDESMQPRKRPRVDGDITPLSDEGLRSLQERFAS